MAHIAFDYELSESTVSRVIKEIESVLLQYILIDATKCPVERPKKEKKMLQQEEKATYSKRSSCN